MTGTLEVCVDGHWCMVGTVENVEVRFVPDALIDDPDDLIDAPDVFPPTKKPARLNARRSWFERRAHRPS